MAEVIDPYVHELLRDLRELTSQQLIYDDNCPGYVPIGDTLGEWQMGPPRLFAELRQGEKEDVLDTFIHWNHYNEKGLDWRDQYTIRYNIAVGMPPHQWLDHTSFFDSSVRAERREELIQETFKLSQKIGYAHFRAENFDRPDPALVRLNPQERETFLRQWWETARERMYASNLEQVAGLSNEELARNREAYKGAVIAGEAASVAYQDMLRDAAARGVGRSEGDKDIER